MADEIKAEPSLGSMDSFTESDGLNSSLMDEFSKAGAAIDVTPDVESTPKPEAEKAPESEAPDQEKPKPNEEKPNEEVKAKGPLPKTAKPKSEPINAAKEDEKLSDPDKIKPPPNLSKAGMEGWNALKESSKKAHAIVEKQRAEITKINLALAEKSKVSTQEVEDLKKKLDELEGYRAKFDYQFDPEFKKQYSEPMQKLETDMRKMLIESGVREDVIKNLNWSDSTQMDRVAKSLDEHVNSIVADRFRMRARDFIELSTKKEDFLQEFQGKHKEFTSKRAQELEQKSMEGDASRLKHVNTLSQIKDDKGEYRFPFLLKFEAQDPQNSEEVQRVEDHNKMVDMMRGRLQKVMSAKDPETMAQVSIAAVAASYLNEQLKMSRDEVTSLREDLKKYNDASSERRGPGQKPSGGKGYKTPESLELDDALSEAFPGMR